jgi:hypothetical protein
MQSRRVKAPVQCKTPSHQQPGRPECKEKKQHQMQNCRGKRQLRAVTFNHPACTRVPCTQTSMVGSVRLHRYCVDTHPTSPTSADSKRSLRVHAIKATAHTQHDDDSCLQQSCSHPGDKTQYPICLILPSHQPALPLQHQQ